MGDGGGGKGKFLFYFICLFLTVRDCNLGLRGEEKFPQTQRSRKFIMWKRWRREIQAAPEFKLSEVPKSPRVGNLIIIESLASFRV